MSKIQYSRNSVAADWRCRRYRYLGHEYGGCGLTKDTTAIELVTGVTLHDGLAAIAYSQKDNGTVDINDIAVKAGKIMLDSLSSSMAGEVGADEYAHEQATLVEGLIRGFYRHAWPRLMKEYPKILLIESELKYEHDGLTFLTKPDLVLASEDGSIYYVEYKSTGWKKEEWVNSWATAIQLHATSKCIEEKLGEKVTAVIVQGLYKGSVYYGKQSSPFCYSYHREGNPPFQQEENLYVYKAGYRKFPVWQLDGGISNWVANMPESLLSEQFPQTPPIFVKEDLVDQFFKQRAIREKDIADTVNLIRALEGLDGGPTDEERAKINEIMNDVFEQNFDQCTPSFGRPCVFKQVCFGGGQNPLDLGFQLRDVSHRSNWGIEG